jgi:small subunit ribosomal protein S19
MARSIKKGPFVDENLIKKIKNLRPGERTAVKTWARKSTISPEMVGFTVAIHNGRTHTPVLIVEDMVGHKLGEFAPTRKFIRHGGRMAREEEQAAAQKESEAVKRAKEENEAK